MGLSLGGGKSKNKSGNSNNGMLTGALGSTVGGAGNATSLMSNVLNGGPGGFADSGGFDFLLKKGTEGVNSDMASRGLLNSGADMKALEDYRGGLAQTFLDKYLGHVNEMGQLGVGAAGVLSDSGKTSKGKSKNASIGLGK